MPEDKHWHHYAARFKSFPARLPQPDITPGLCICIPVYAEPDLISTLESVMKCKLPLEPVEVLLLFNQDNRMTAEDLVIHEQAWLDAEDWINNEAHQKQGITFSLIRVSEMPDPKGGVGWARKLVMDEAARRLDQSGVILCLDADCKVSENYIETVRTYFFQNPSCDAASIYFEHTLDNLNGNTKSHIIEYELHLRYLVNVLKWTGHPYAYHTVGSSMACRRSAYLAQGGMNTRQAGEDFYFLQKFAETGTLHEIHATTVFPSPRKSSRVPFGTGRAMQQLASDHREWETTSPESYVQIKPLFDHIELLRLWAMNDPDKKSFESFCDSAGISSNMKNYLMTEDFIDNCIEIARYTSSEIAFRKRFFRYFNAFRMIRYTHDMRDVHYPDVPVLEATKILAEKLRFQLPTSSGVEEYLTLYRELDKNAIQPG